MKTSSSARAAEQECEQRGHNIGAIASPAGELIFMCSKCGMSRDAILGGEETSVLSGKIHRVS
jgi:hypothetical protein